MVGGGIWTVGSGGRGEWWEVGGRGGLVGNVKEAGNIRTPENCLISRTVIGKSCDPEKNREKSEKREKF
jgi:hypothetical protein